ncbi:hypothetical protein J1N35_023244 [Gossypium stocksii]|uniref:DDE Tnp4 domain-containing protein n=1 Tax=Gossypium stocksii TaxID=47602 RepID=A0A9D4A300_9ROSI|nr:hypothetical protein J1N35_023244 [Gossypium stocksii]
MVVWAQRSSFSARFRTATMVEPLHTRMNRDEGPFPTPLRPTAEEELPTTDPVYIGGNDIIYLTFIEIIIEHLEKKEIFNHAHSSLRSVIERTFGVWKKIWPILRDIPSYLFDKQVLIVIATIVLHNYIQRHAWSNDEDFRQFDNIPDMPISSGHFDRGESSSSNSESDLEIAMLRETIANSLMNQYL